MRIGYDAPSFDICTLGSEGLICASGDTGEGFGPPSEYPGIVDWQ